MYTSLLVERCVSFSVHIAISQVLMSVPHWYVCVGLFHFYIHVYGSQCVYVYVSFSREMCLF